MELPVISAYYPGPLRRLRETFFYFIPFPNLSYDEITTPLISKFLCGIYTGLIAILISP